MSRPGLYIMVFFALMYSCSASNNAERANAELRHISEWLNIPAATKVPAKPVNNQ